MRRVHRDRSVCVAVAVAFGVAALATRRYAAELPPYVWLYWGDTLWAVMVYFAAAAVLNQRPSRHVAAIALVGMYAVEASQLLHAPWLDAFRRTLVGGLLLGHGFLWSDMVCYTIGVAAAVALEIAGRVSASTGRRPRVET